MVHAKELKCFSCNTTYPPEQIIFRCEVCGGSLEVNYYYKTISKLINLEDLKTIPPSVWKYKWFYPIDDFSKVISLKEGGTPLLEAKNLEESLELDNLLLKYEGLNPTGSFKDRGSTIEITKANEFQAKRVVCASTGNMGASVAAYASKARIDCLIYVPKFASGIKVNQIKSYGARVFEVDGTYDKALKLATKKYRKEGYYLMGDYPYRGEGQKSIAYELADQLGWRVPDIIISPIGNGTLLYSIFKGFRELIKVGLTDKIPSMYGVQAKGCNPVVRAFERGKEVEPILKPNTIATAINCGNPIDGDKALFAIRATNGLAVDVSDKQILEAKKLLAKQEGIYAETSGAVALAGLKELIEQRRINLDKKIVCLVTGHGLKEF